MRSWAGYLWGLLPAVLRAYFWRVVLHQSRRAYGQTGFGGRVQRLPGGLYAKIVGEYGAPAIRSHKAHAEALAMRLVASQTSIPVPAVVDLVPYWYANDDTSEDEVRRFLLVMTAAEGLVWADAAAAWEKDHPKGGADCFERFVSDLQAVAEQLKTVYRNPPPKEEEAVPLLEGERDSSQQQQQQQAICNSLGLAVCDFRVLGHFAGPFACEPDFHAHIAPPHSLAALPAAARALIADVHSRTHAICFTHADLNPWNVFVDAASGRITGIIDWENAGWYPEYWEFTKAFYIGAGPKWDELMHGAFGDRHGDELKAERSLWMLKDSPF